MALLEICQRASDLIGLPEISSVIGNAQKTPRQLLEIVKSGGNQIAQQTNGSGGSWSVLERVNEFPTVADETEYDLPNDFGKLITQTAWQKDKYWLMRGSVTPQQWQNVRNRQASTPNSIFRILRTAGNAQPISAKSFAANSLRKFTLEPAPGEAITLVYEYVSRFWWVDTTGTTFKRAPDEDTDESLFGDDMHVLDAVWRFKKANGLVYDADLAEFEIYRDRALIQDEAAEPISVGYDRRAYANADESDVEWCP